MQSLLHHLVERTLDGQEDRLKERLIGIDVFGRPSDYNTGDDPIVRLRVGDVRKRLAQYYQSDESRGAALEINIPPGSYLVHFQDRTAEAANHGAAEISLDPALAVDSPQHTHPRTLPLAWVAAACLAGLALGVVGTLAVAHFRRVDGSVPNAGAISNPILRRIFSPNAEVNVVLADANLATLLEAVNRDSISVGDYENSKYPDFLLTEITDPALRAVLERETHRRFTPLGNADIATKCVRWGTTAGTPVTIKYGRYLHVRDFQQGNFVVVGDRVSNPWITLFEPKLNFYQEEDSGGLWFHFKNRNPKPGEPQTYALRDEGGGSYAGYVDIAVLPNPLGTGSVLLLSGLWGDMSNAAADLIFAKDLPSTLSRALEAQSDRSTTEILLRVHDVNGAQSGSEIVSIRTSAP